MKKIILTAVSILLSSFAYADEMPSWLSLPNQGKNCTLLSSFDELTPITCGVKSYEVWQCIEESGDSFIPANNINYMIFGEYESDTVPGCSPTFVVKKVIKSNQ